MQTSQFGDRNLAIVTVNYRAAHDTIECLESLLHSNTDARLIVVDNASGDGSADRIMTWATSKPELAKDFDFREGGAPSTPLTKRLTLIASDENGGFAKGNNVGLRPAMATDGIELFWLLNNDTVVEPDTVDAIVRFFRKKPDIGMAGTQLRLYHQPGTLQLLNGMRFSKLTGAAAGVEAGSPIDTPFDPDEVVEQSDFICGASLLMSREFLESTGLLEERFFLYYEEVDLAYRGSRFEMGFVDDAIVYHKEGASAGSASQLSNRARSPLSEYHHIRSKMIFARKHLPAIIPLYALQNVIILGRRLLRRQPRQAAAVLRASLGLPFRG